MNTLRIVRTWLAHLLYRERHSLRGRMIASLSCLLLVLIALQVWEHSDRIRDRRRSLEQSQREIAVAAASALRTGLEQLFDSETIVGRTVLTGRMPEEQVPAYLGDVRDQYPGIAAVQVLGGDGKIRWASPPPEIGLDPADTAFLQRLTPQAPRQISSLAAGGTEGEQFRVSTLLAEPDGTTLGIVSMEFFPHAIQTWLPRLDGTQTLVVLDGAGSVAYCSRGFRVQEAARSDPGIRRAVQRRQPQRLSLRVGGEGELAGYAVPVPETEWTVAYLLPTSPLVAVVSEDTQVAVFVMVVAIAVLAIAISLALHFSLRPLVRLSAATRKLGSGDLSFRLPPAEVPEFDGLVESFNRMAARLENTQEQLLEANRELEARVRERTRALEEEHQKLLRAERLSTVGLFSSAIAHDLRNPLNTINLGVHWLRLRLADYPDERLKARIDTIERELQRSERIIKALLAFARTGELDRHPTDLNELLQEVLEVIGPQPSVQLRAELPPDVCELSLDRAQFFQVFENLIRNAIQAMPEGGQVTVSSEVGPRSCRVRISDTGPGIPPEMQAAVFEPLVTTKSTGTGLGLALCKRIVDAHGGQISVTSHPGDGATFLIELPLAAPAPAELVGSRQ